MMHPRATRSGTKVQTCYRRAKGDANETFNGKRFKTLTHVRAYQAEAR